MSTGKPRAACLSISLQRIVLVSIMLYQNISAIPASAQGIEWIRQFGGLGPDSAMGVSVFRDATYVVGTTGANGFLGNDAFIRKFSLDGTTLWIRLFSAGSLTVPVSVAANEDGVYVVGFTNGSLPGNPSSGGRDIFLRKYSQDGGEVWTRQFGTAKNDIPDEVVVVPDGIYIAGWVNGALPSQANLGGLDAFLRKYDRNGIEQWTRQFGSLGHDTAGGLAADETGIYAAGSASGILPGTAGTVGPSIFLRRYDADGNLRWSKQYGPSNAVLTGVALSANGIYSGGFLSGTMPDQASAGSNDGFISRFDKNGVELWTRQFGTSGSDQVRAVAATGAGVFLGGDTGDPGLASTGQDLFVKMYLPDGSEGWTTRLGTGMLFNLGNGISADSSAVYFAGEVLGESARTDKQWNARYLFGKAGNTPASSCSQRRWRGE